jgi:hypothetical protein
MLADRLNNPILAVVALALFVALAVHCMKPCVKYPLADACVNGVYTPVKEMSEHDARLIVSLYGV